jgi:hypothetical protein
MVTYQVPPDNRADMDPGHFADHTKISDNFSLLLMMPSGDVTGATDRTAIQARLSQGYEVRLGPGDFYLNDVLTPSSGSSLIGSGIASTVIHQVSTSKNGIDWAGGNLSSVTVRSLTLSGPNSGTGRGISLVASTGGDPNVQGCHFEDLLIIDFGSHGFYAEILIVSGLANVISRSNGGDGFGLGGGTNTSVTFQNCWADSNTSAGYDLENVTYSALIGCAADSNSIGFFIYNCTGVSLSGCGAEASATCFQVSGGTGITLASCFTFHCSGKSFLVTSLAKNVTLIGCSENTPSGSPTASFQFDTGTSVNVIGWTFVTAAVQTAPPNQLNDGSGNFAVAGSSFLNTTNIYGITAHNAGTATAGSAPAITPTFANGTASQLADSSRDYMVYLQVGTPGTAFTLAIGPTSGVATTIVSSATPTAAELFAVRLPAGWFLKWAGTSTTLARQTAVGC